MPFDLYVIYFVMLFHLARLLLKWHCFEYYYILYIFCSFSIFQTFHIEFFVCVFEHANEWQIEKCMRYVCVDA